MVRPKSTEAKLRDGPPITGAEHLRKLTGHDALFLYIRSIPDALLIKSQTLLKNNYLPQPERAT